MLLIGSEAEEIVYTYGSCDRAVSYPTLAAPEPRLLDRFTGTVTTPTLQLVRDFVELTIANGLDVLSHNEDLLAQHGDSLRGLFTAWRPHASEPAGAAVCEFFSA